MQDLIRIGILPAIIRYTDDMPSTAFWASVFWIAY
jgi:hypothetical protein